MVRDSRVGQGVTGGEEAIRTVTTIIEAVRRRGHWSIIRGSCKCLPMSIHSIRDGETIHKRGVVNSHERQKCVALGGNAEGSSESTPGRCLTCQT